MGAVYLARHPRLPRYDALKVLARGADPRFRERFQREARLASRLDHPNVVSIHGSGEDGELLWIAMQFVDGQDSAQLVRDGGLTAERAIAIVTQAARGLDAAHRSGLLHRDVKPANILVTQDDERVLVADFGIAREAADPTATGMLRATPAYAAPEQIRGGSLDHRADVYGLGATLYHLLTGQVPYPRDSTAAMVHAHLTATPPRPSRIAPTLPVALDAVLARALAKDPAERFRSCGELAEAARATLGGKTFQRIRRTRRGALAAAATATVAATVAAVVLTDAAPSDTSAGPSPQPAVVAPPTTQAPESPWGNAAFIVDAFTSILPAKPSTRGYLNMTCEAVDDPTAPAVVCTGDNNTVWWLQVTCRTDRTEYPAATPGGTDPGTARWSHGTGTGTAVWRTSPDQYRTTVGNLEIRFDTPDRNFCALEAYGMASGKDLYEQWWEMELV
ncbi:serine/threonine protein kinase [Nocardia huaxiensis]|uniref:non-specific serine/threonine protein kinase n=2 Tax=Nocardia huaxiensis TaxID=2755382 RepID=A0A7D6ZMK7_9NOCA|nr:serine/threonine protein kinase [Nocardia huaxiensis]